jgi:hypothetical protein
MGNLQHRPVRPLARAQAIRISLVDAAAAHVSVAVFCRLGIF